MSELFAKYQFGAIHTAGITDGKVTGKPSHESGTPPNPRYSTNIVIHCAMIIRRVDDYYADTPYYRQ